jgi:nitrogen-specific signal transduction histidine kinase/CheY-like chemotaxis protein
MRDITERKKMEEKLIQSEKLSALGELAGGVAHDFNNMLAAILGRVQLLRMHNSPLPGVREKRKSVRELQKGLEIIEKAAMDGAETVRRIQEFSRRRSDDKDFTQVDVNELINSALEFTRMRWKNAAESKGIKIVVEKDFSPIPPTIGSGAELREVFTNLLNNALDAMPHGGRITFKTIKEDNYICVAVKDTGSGIPKAVREKIFDPFFTTRGPQSTGLGLSVSYGIISRHRGTITVDSMEGEGTTFTIKLPILAKAIKEEKIEFKPGQKRKARILVIDDEEGVRNVLNDILTDAGHEVEIAGDGIQGIELFERKEFDLVFTDLGMPVVSGWQVAERIKGINRKVPIALITGWNVDLKESEMTSSCIDLIIKKPFAVDQVLRLVQEGMELRERFKAA